MTRRLTERQLEDYICQHLDHTPFSPSWLPERLKCSVIERQVAVPHGIIDILIGGNQVIYVVELKAWGVKEKDVGQVMRYVHDIRSLLCIIGQDLYSLIDPRYRMNFSQSFDLDKNVVKPVIIGSDIDNKTYASASGAGIDVMIWEQVDGRVSVERYISAEGPMPIPTRHGNISWVPRIADIALTNFANRSGFDNVYSEDLWVPITKGHNS